MWCSNFLWQSKKIGFKILTVQIFLLGKTFWGKHFIVKKTLCVKKLGVQQFWWVNIFRGLNFGRSKLLVGKSVRGFKFFEVSKFGQGQNL